MFRALSFWTRTRVIAFIAARATTEPSEGLILYKYTVEWVELESPPRGLCGVKLSDSCFLRIQPIDADRFLSH